MHAYAMFPQCGIIDNVVNTNDKVQIFDDLSAIIFSNVGRILLEKNSLTYTQNVSCFILLKVKIVINYETHSKCRASVSFSHLTFGRTYSPAFAVPSAHITLTSLFGMGRGDFYMPYPPSQYYYSLSLRLISKERSNSNSGRVNKIGICF